MLRTLTPAVLGVAACAVLALAGTGLAHTTTGGASAPQRPQITELRCGTGAEVRCPVGELLRLAGEFLESTRTVLFLGGRGHDDNREARPSEASAHEVLVRVPASAASGPVRVKSTSAGASRPSPKIEVAAASVAEPDAAPDRVFPVRGAHDFGTAVNGFGGGRNHQGQDILAECGTPVLAVRPGRVTWVRSEGAAGNYAVVSAADGTSQVYMHLLEPAPLEQGQRVTAGQRIGQVGQTGRASTCHLHFETWTAPGWYRGGAAVDPLPLLRQLARGATGH